VIGLKDASFDPQQFVIIRDVIRKASHRLPCCAATIILCWRASCSAQKEHCWVSCATSVKLLVDMLGAVQLKDFETAVAMQSRAQGFLRRIHLPAPYGDYRARSKVALVAHGAIDPGADLCAPPFPLPVGG